VICKQAGASLSSSPARRKDRARIEVAKKLGADYRHRRAEGRSTGAHHGITGGKGVDVALDCTAGAGTIPILLASRRSSARPA